MTDDDATERAREMWNRSQIRDVAAVAQAIRDAEARGERRGIERAAARVLSGSFLHDESPEARWAQRVTGLIRALRVGTEG